MIYKTKNLELHPFTKKDITFEYLAWFNDPTTTNFNSHGLGSYIKEDAEKYFDDNLNNIVFKVILKKGEWTKKHKEQYRQLCLPSCYANLRKNYFLANDKGEGIHIGNISLQRINQISRSAELAIVMGETEYWGKGFATEALKKLLEHGFDKMNLHRIWSGTANPNIGMQKVFKKLGFAQEGTFQDGTWLNGQYEDVLCYGLLEDEWRDNESEIK